MSIVEVVHFANGLVMVFDEEGQQMSEYQGKYEEVKDKILRDSHAGSVFIKAKNLKEGYVEVAKEDF